MKSKKSFEKDMKIAYINNYTRMVADLFFIYKKHYDITQFTFDHIMNDAKDEVRLTKEEFEIVKQNTKWYLKHYRGIEIIQENPIRIQSEKQSKT